MNRITKYIIFTYLTMFLFIFNVKAECSYQERKTLLDESKKVDIFITLKTKKEMQDVINNETGATEQIEIDSDYFVFNIANLSKNIYIKVYNSQNPIEYFYVFDYSLKDGIYSFEEYDTMNLIKYNFEFYSNKENCLGYEINKKTIIKPKYNSYSDLDLCKNDKTASHEYCKKYIDKNYNNSKIYNTLQSLVSKNTEIIEKEPNIIQRLDNYWYLIVLGILIIITITIILIKRRQRNEL